MGKFRVVMLVNDPTNAKTVHEIIEDVKPVAALEAGLTVEAVSCQVEAPDETAPEPTA